MQNRAAAREVFGVLVDTTTLLDELHDATNRFSRRDNVDTCPRFFDALGVRWAGQIKGGLDRKRVPVTQIDSVCH